MGLLKKAQERNEVSGESFLKAQGVKRYEYERTSNL